MKETRNWLFEYIKEVKGLTIKEKNLYPDVPLVTGNFSPQELSLSTINMDMMSDSDENNTYTLAQ